MVTEHISALLNYPFCDNYKVSNKFNVMTRILISGRKNQKKKPKRRQCEKDSAQCYWL
jgi:hypothetical protein